MPPSRGLMVRQGFAPDGPLAEVRRDIYSSYSTPSGKLESTHSDTPENVKTSVHKTVVGIAYPKLSNIPKDAAIPTDEPKSHWSPVWPAHSIQVTGADLPESPRERISSTTTATTSTLGGPDSEPDDFKTPMQRPSSASRNAVGDLPAEAYATPATSNRSLRPFASRASPLSERRPSSSLKSQSPAPPADAQSARLVRFYRAEGRLDEAQALESLQQQSLNDPGSATLLKAIQDGELDQRLRKEWQQYISDTTDSGQDGSPVQLRKVQDEESKDPEVLISESSDLAMDEPTVLQPIEDQSETIQSTVEEPVFLTFATEEESPLDQLDVEQNTSMLPEVQSPSVRTEISQSLTAPDYEEVDVDVDMVPVVLPMPSSREVSLAPEVSSAAPDSHGVDGALPEEDSVHEGVNDGLEIDAANAEDISIPGANESSERGQPLPSSPMGHSFVELKQSEDAAPAIDELMAVEEEDELMADVDEIDEFDEDVADALVGNKGDPMLAVESKLDDAHGEEEDRDKAAEFSQPTFQPASTLLTSPGPKTVPLSQPDMEPNMEPDTVQPSDILSKTNPHTSTPTALKSQNPSRVNKPGKPQTGKKSKKRPSRSLHKTHDQIRRVVENDPTSLALQPRSSSSQPAKTSNALPAFPPPPSMNVAALTRSPDAADIDFEDSPDHFPLKAWPTRPAKRKDQRPPHRRGGVGKAKKQPAATPKTRVGRGAGELTRLQFLDMMERRG